MSGFFVDVSRTSFWLVFAAAVVILTPLTAPTARKWAFAAINAAFLATLLTPLQVAVVIGSVCVLGLALRWVPAGVGRNIVIAAIGVATVGLFFVHKLPSEASRVGLGAANPILIAVGFSYVALRLCEVLRAVAEGRHQAPDFPSFINYLLPFHMLAAGPIQAYDDFVAQPAVPSRLTPVEALGAVERIASGLFKKFVIAAVLKSIFLTGFRARGPYVLLEAQFFFLWLYLDFSSLSDLAVGIGRLIGFATPENFNQPYLARNMIAFWERWHISLSQFIRRNLFLPMQITLMRRTGATHPLWCASAAFLVSFGLCGLWHEVSFRWFVWGLLNAIGLIVTNWYRDMLNRRLGRRGVKDYLENRWIKIAAMVLTYEFVCLSLVVVAYPYPLGELIARNLSYGYSISR